jgi:hypothetical protein
MDWANDRMRSPVNRCAFSGRACVSDKRARAFVIRRECDEVGIHAHSPNTLHASIMNILLIGQERGACMACLLSCRDERPRSDV